VHKIIVHRRILLIPHDVVILGLCVWNVIRSRAPLVKLYLSLPFLTMAQILRIFESILLVFCYSITALKG
jgi:hypothetical protein